jgi:hypothetical protein
MFISKNNKAELTNAIRKFAKLYNKYIFHTMKILIYFILSFAWIHIEKAKNLVKFS